MEPHLLRLSMREVSIEAWLEIFDLRKFSPIFLGYSPLLHPTPANVPDVGVAIRISGPEPGYKTTCIVFLEVASLMLRRRDAIKKGVLTPAVAFGDLDHTSHNVASGDGGVLDVMRKDGRVTWSIISS